MLKDRILSTLKFFDFQDIPLTLLELHHFLIGDLGRITLSQDENFELFKDAPMGGQSHSVSLDEILRCIDEECGAEVGNTLGYYHLSGREGIVSRRLDNYFFGLKRERRIRRFLGFLRHIPFVRGVGVGGSQSLGQQKESSDIDLLIVTANGFMWLARTFISLYFQILGMRRHGKYIQNRFCLNHYVAGAKAVDRERNLYKAMEYARLRPLIYPQGVAGFLEKNRTWMQIYFPNFYTQTGTEPQPLTQKIFETLLKNPFGEVFERLLGFIQKHKIREDEFTFVLPDELSFHPHSQHRALLLKFFSV